MTIGSIIGTSLFWKRCQKSWGDEGSRRTQADFYLVLHCETTGGNSSTFVDRWGYGAPQITITRLKAARNMLWVKSYDYLYNCDSFCAFAVLKKNEGSQWVKDVYEDAFVNPAALGLLEIVSSWDRFYIYYGDNVFLYRYILSLI